VAIGILPEIAGVENAVGQAAQRAFGAIGGGFIAAGILASVVGINSASALILPRRLSALAEQGDLPRSLARLHPRWGTPWLAILVVYALTGAAALAGTFEELVLLSVVARLLQYVPTCLAVLVFRRGPRPGVGPPAFRLALGPVVPVAALGLCAWLLSTLGWPHLLAAGAAALCGLPCYFAARRAAGRDGG
jgi:amino acid transporter